VHVDGFRFDLAANLGRATIDSEPFGGFLDAIGQEPVVSQVKLIAEPWDIRAGRSINLVTVHRRVHLHRSRELQRQAQRGQGEDDRHAPDDNRTLLLSAGVPLILSGTSPDGRSAGATTPTRRTTRSAGST
jgi:hypothetical protein